MNSPSLRDTASSVCMHMVCTTCAMVPLPCQGKKASAATPQPFFDRHRGAGAVRIDAHCAISLIFAHSSTSINLETTSKVSEGDAPAFPFLPALLSQKTSSQEELSSRMSESEDVHRMRQRNKQITYGKQTKAYETYSICVPKSKRQRHNSMHPNTPDIHVQGVSKRRFDGLVKAWRRALHQWDDVIVVWDGTRFTCETSSES